MSTDVVEKIIGNRYRIETLIGKGGMGVVYKALDRFTGDYVAVKQVQIEEEPEHQHGQHNFRLALTHEFKVMASLRHPHIVSVLDYGFDEDGMPFYTMEWLQNAQPMTTITLDLGFEERVMYLIQLLQALAFLHRRGIYHRDLKPDNVMIDQQGVLRVLDFGLAFIHNQPPTTDNATGTLAYMAPETLQGYPPTTATDLYAVGIMAYEIFMEAYPFSLKDINSLMHDVISTMPTFDNDKVSPNLMMIIERLMMKDPSDRYQHATEVIEALSQILDTPMQTESLAIRESFLQSAEFIGREAEMAQLQKHLRQALSGRGQALLIGGDSGTGKSRLLEELRTYALVNGANVVRGQGISEGGSPYALWRNTLRWLAMVNRPGDLEARVLKPLIPDIADLLGHPVEDPPELSPQAMQARIINIMEMLFEHQPNYQPLVVILEDIHWAGSESLTALEHIVKHLENVPILIVASYRSDEMPTLPDVLNLPVLMLEKLSNKEIKALSISMLGAVGQQGQVVDLLQRTTEGNAFFLIEVVRALAEETGSLDSIGTQTIPGHIFEGGFANIINRRLEQVPTRLRHLLELSAILGRQIDVSVLQVMNDHLPPLQQVDINEWLESLSDLSILNVVDNQWQFIHDKLREGLVNLLDDIENRDKHRRVAEALETLYGETPEYMAKLAYHWRNVGDSNKELVYVMRAGDQMLRNGAYQEAVNYFTRALDIAGKSKLTPLKRATLLRKKSAAYVALGNLAEGETHLRESLALYGYPAPDESELNRRLGGQLLNQLIHRTFPFIFFGRRATDYDELVEVVAAHEQLVELAYYTNNSMMGLYASLRTLNISELLGVSKYLGRAYGAVSYVSILVSERISDMYYRKGIQVAYQYGDRLSIARTHQVSTLRYMARGAWDQAEHELNEALKIYEELGDLRYWTSGAQTLGEVYYFRGQFQQSIDLRKTLYETAMRYGDIQAQGFGLRGQAMNLVIMGSLNHAEEFAQAAVSRYSASNDQIGEADSWGLLALINLRQERYRRALVNAEQVIQLVTQQAPTSYNLLVSYYTTAETLLSLYERNNGSDHPKLAEMITLVMKSFKLYARRFRIGKPRYYLYMGRWKWLNGKQTDALKLWNEGLKLATALHMPYDTALLQYEIGSRNPERTSLLTTSIEAFQKLNALYDAERAKSVKI